MTEQCECPKDRLIVERAFLTRMEDAIWRGPVKCQCQRCSKQWAAVPIRGQNGELVRFEYREAGGE